MYSSLTKISKQTALKLRTTFKAKKLGYLMTIFYRKIVTQLISIIQGS